jgi:dipeptidyl aminopeptidase/acylaminoacyl peptidase
LVNGAPRIRCFGVLLGVAWVALGGEGIVAGQTADAAASAELAFQNGGRIYTVRADGSTRRLITGSVSERAQALEPAWSPDGTTLAISHARAVSGDDERAQIQLMQADGSGRRNLTTLAKGVVDFSPRWSPGGDQVVFVRYVVRGARYTSSIVIYDLRTGTERTVDSPAARSTARPAGRARVVARRRADRLHAGAPRPALLFPPIAVRRRSGRNGKAPASARRPGGELFARWDADRVRERA